MMSWILLAVLSAAEPTGTIAFLQETKDGGGKVHLASIGLRTVDPIGLGPRDGAPTWSPDGSFVAFTMESGLKRRIGVWSAEKERLTVLSAPEPASDRLAWSSDSARIAFEDGSNDDWRIGVVYLESGRVDYWGGGATGLVSPIWIDDRELIRRMFVGDPGIDFRLRAQIIAESGILLALAWQPDATPPTTEPVLLTRYERIPVSTSILPSPSPHAEWGIREFPRMHSLAFESDDGGNREIFAYSVRRGIICLSNHRAADWNPIWSPSGFWVMFESFRGGRRGLYRAHRDTARVEVVSALSRASSWGGAWSPDSEWVAFVSDYDGVPHLWVTPSRGGDIRRLTNTEQAEGAPAWRPTTR